MSTSQLSTADNMFVGKGRDTLTANFWDRTGVPVHLPTRAVLGTPALGDADFLIKAATSTELPAAAGTITYSASASDASPHDAAATTTTINGVTVWDVCDGSTYGRNLVSVATATAVVAMSILISGYDYTGQAMSELHAITTGSASKTVTGSKAFAYVRSVAITVAADATGNTLNIGTGAKLGLPFRLTSLGDMFRASIGGVQESINVASNATVVSGVATSPATNVTGDVRGTIAFNTALDGSKEAVAWYYIAGHASKSGVAGVAQA